MKDLIIIPTYNEASNIAALLMRIKSSVPTADVLVVDDGSPDGTADLVASINNPQVHLLRRTHKQGLGPAYLAGFAWALSRQYDRIIEMDADGSHRPEELPSLLAASEHADLVIGARWIDGGSVVHWPRSRELISRIGNIYVRLALGLRVHDATAGFRVYRANTLRAIDLPTVASNGYCFQIDLTYRTSRAGFVISEVPITFVERELGVSKMSRAIVVEALWRTSLWGLRRVFSPPKKG